MAELKRLEVKYIRDASKAAYVKDDSCFICRTDETLEFHHFYSMTLLWNKWKKDNGIAIATVDDIMLHRETFITEHRQEIYDETVTLCKVCHAKLHKIYNKCPPLYTAKKQKRWTHLQRERNKNSEKA